jgi:hypothetical protein
MVKNPPLMAEEEPHQMQKYDIRLVIQFIPSLTIPVDLWASSQLLVHVHHLF